MLRFGLGLDEATPDNLLLVDDDLNVLDGDGMPNPSNRFHLWLYRAKPHVHSIMHTHPPHVSALSIDVPLAIAHMDTTLFQDDCAWLPEWPGTPIGDDEGRIISDNRISCAICAPRCRSRPKTARLTHSKSATV